MNLNEEYPRYFCQTKKQQNFQCGRLKCSTQGVSKVLYSTENVNIFSGTLWKIKIREYYTENISKKNPSVRLGNTMI